MSEEIGATLPPPLRFELGSHPSGDAVKAILLLTVDHDGSVRVAVLAPAEIRVEDASRIAVRLASASGACANIKRAGKAALWYVLDAAAYCIRCDVRADEQPSLEPDHETFTFEIRSVLRDFHPGAPMVSGPTYKRT